jgi:hypothetical protein
MHTRWIRPYELTHDRHRRVLHMSQKSGGGGDIDTIASKPVAAYQVLTGFTYQHASFGGGVDLVSMGIDSTFRDQVQPTIPALQTQLVRPYGQGLNGDAWPNHDKRMNHTLARQQSPLNNAAGYVFHIWTGSSFNGSSSTVTLRDRQPSDIMSFTLAKQVTPNADTTLTVATTPTTRYTGSTRTPSARTTTPTPPAPSSGRAIPGAAAYSYTNIRREAPSSSGHSGTLGL